MPSDSDQQSLQADEQMRAATQKLRELVAKPPSPVDDDSAEEEEAAAGEESGDPDI